MPYPHQGPAPSAQSYLDGKAILRACKLTGAQAVHPGYGFLSEKSEFVDLLEKNGIVFIGPKTKSMAAMGDKIASKKLAAASKVNTVPGYQGVVKNDEEVLKIARQIGYFRVHLTFCFIQLCVLEFASLSFFYSGFPCVFPCRYPVMIKASAGGGGKGMRVAWNDKEALSGFALSTSEAKSSFADDRVFIEKFIEEPRHIEIQVLGDSFGNTVYLNERECTIQRRNQKIIEEAPSVFLTPELRKAMGEQAVALAKAVNYESAGTVEFLVDKNRNFYFLEMNTRLQVEHPVTECITGVDLVHQMIRVAAGLKLQMKQEDVALNGWALESRVYAENPLRNFMPSIGRLRKYQEPENSTNFALSPQGIRCDAGVGEGSEISIHYDPMICKLVTYGKDRTEAIDKMRLALDSYVIRGVTHNVNFLRSLVDHPRFLKGDMSTAFIQDEYPDGYKGQSLTAAQMDVLIGASAMLHAAALVNKVGVTGQMGSFAAHLPDQMHVAVGTGEGCTVQLGDFKLDGDKYHAKTTITHANKAETALDLAFSWSKGSLLIHVTVGEQPYILQLISQTNNDYTVQHIGTTFQVRVLTPAEHALAKHMPVSVKGSQSNELMSPMPGAVFAVKVAAGDTVSEGQEVIVIEAMKMQNALMAPKSGKVSRACCYH